MRAARGSEDANAEAGPSTTDPGSEHCDELEGTLECRISNLPRELLHDVLRRSGRPTRLVCRHFHDTYGPLTGGLHLSPANYDGSSLEDSPPLTCYPSLHTLVINPPKQYGPPRDISFYYCQGLHPSSSAMWCKIFTFLKAAPRHFPALRSLHLPLGWHMQVSSADSIAAIASLAPLARTLTHLTLCSITSPHLVALAAALPALRSLRLRISFKDYNAAGFLEVCDLTTTGVCMRHLVDLQIDSSLCVSAEPLLKSLAATMPHLTRLCIGHRLCGFHNTQASRTLASAWPQLADLELGISDHSCPCPPLAPAVAQHTALTRLVLRTGRDCGGWDYLHMLPLRELHISADPFRHQPQGTMAMQLGTLTRLVLDGGVVLDDELAGHLSLLAGSLLSLLLRADIRQCGHLVRLSCLSRLQDLSLSTVRDWDKDQAVTGEQAASGLAAGLSQLCYLHICYGFRQPQVERSLVACLAPHGMLRELHITVWNPRLPVQLAAVAGTLGRLSISCQCDANVFLVISSCKRLERLHYLEVRGGSAGKLWQPQPTWVEGRDPPGNQGPPPEPDATQWPEWRELEAGALAAAKGGEGGRVWLPPRLRVLAVGESGGGHYRWSEDGKVLSVLHRAAKEQGCAVRVLQLPYGSNGACLAAQWDDCGGYEEGASLEWLRRHGRL